MKITYLGHAGFIAETDNEMVVMDPWLSSDGAFDLAWFQFPCNHHLLGPTIDRIKNTAKKVYVYISHIHQDHFDKGFLQHISRCPITIIIPDFRRKHLSDSVKALGFDVVKTMGDGEKVPLQDGYMRVFVDDNELNCDSAIILNSSGFNFLNLNDCKIFDRLSQINLEDGHVNLFTCQYSGAVWHPTCYDYDPSRYEEIARNKLAGKFRAIGNAVSMLQPDWYVPSAGPPCFLDPELMHLNFEKTNIFAKQKDIVRYIGKRRGNTKTCQLHPGDVFDTELGDFSRRGEGGVADQEFRRYIEEYAARRADGFQRLRTPMSRDRRIGVLERLADELRRKLDRFYVREDYDVRLFYGVFDVRDRYVAVNLRENRVSFVTRLPKSKRFVLMAPAWQVERVLDRRLSWEEFCLTFRVRLSRDPDKYDTLLQGFFYAEIEDVEPLCDRILEIRNRKGRITIEVDGRSYEIDAHCPHQGGDLRYGWAEDGRFWVCPRHRWKFDLGNGGECQSSGESIHAGMPRRKIADSA